MKLNKYTPGFQEWLTEEGYKTLTSGYLLDGETQNCLFNRVSEAATQYLKGTKFSGVAQEVFYHILSKGWLGLATPVASNLGTDRGLPISCFLGVTPNSIRGIGEALTESMILGKYGGGLGYDFSDINGLTHAHRWAKQFDVAASNVKQGGNASKKNGEKVVRKGSVACYLRIDHPDIDEFLNAKELLNGDHREKLDCNIAVTIPDDFMSKIIDHINGTGRYVQEWERFIKVIELRMAYGSPYILFLDNVQRQDPPCYKDKGYKTRQSNLCNEIMLHTDEKTTAVCCLSSLNLALYDVWKSVRIHGYSVPFWATVFLDCVMEEFLQKTKDKYGFERSYQGASLHRPLGLGVIGYHTYLQKNLIPFESVTARKVNSNIFEYIQSESKKASQEMSQELGEPEGLKGYGLRNSHTTAVAPTTSNAVLAGGVSQSIEPIPSNYYTFTGSKGTFIRKNKELDSVLNNLGLDNDQIWKSISENNGSVQHLPIPQMFKDVFLTAMEINQKEIINQASERQRYICQGQSLNLFINPEEDKEKVLMWHILSWKLGLKGLYYVRSKNVTIDKKSQEDQNTPILSSKFLIKSRPDCIYCIKAKTLLEQLGYEYIEEFKEKGQVPEIYLNGEFIGGYTELYKKFNLKTENKVQEECLNCEG